MVKDAASACGKGFAYALGYTALNNVQLRWIDDLKSTPTEAAVRSAQPRLVRAEIHGTRGRDPPP